MTTSTDLAVDVPLPAGAQCADPWEPDDPHAFRIILGADRSVTDHTATVSPSAVQWADGTVDDGGIEPARIYVFGLGENTPLNTDQARELASALLETAREVDGWTER